MSNSLEAKICILGAQGEGQLTRIVMKVLERLI